MIEDGVFVVRGERVERLAAMTDFDNDEALGRFEAALARLGVDNRLREARARATATRYASRKRNSSTRELRRAALFADHGGSRLLRRAAHPRLHRRISRRADSSALAHPTYNRVAR